MGRTVVLRHDLPDGSHHFDWLLDPAKEAADPHRTDPDARVLIAWRMGARPDAALPAEMAAERLPPHRNIYLTFEGAISGGRGEVARVRAGLAEVLADEPDRFEAIADFGAGAVRISGTPATDGRWRLRLAAATGE
jgi:hypothetical protein